MLPAPGIAAPLPPHAEPPSPAARRLAAALDRIAGALVRRAEADAAEREAALQASAHDADMPAPPHVAAERSADHALDIETLQELRHRVDAAITRVRAALGEA